MRPPSLRQIVAELDWRQLVTIQTGDELFTTVTAQPRFVTSLLTAFAALALLLAAARLYRRRVLPHQPRRTLQSAQRANIRRSGYIGV
jgi:hypothetical protein